MMKCSVQEWSLLVAWFIGRFLFFVDANADENAAEEYAQLKARLGKLAHWMVEKSCRASGSGS
jgi:hypothetical protein